MMHGQKAIKPLNYDIGVVTVYEILLVCFLDSYTNAVFGGLVYFSICIKYEKF
jgi:hypothetical protein